jgi:pyruvate formate lyase activating enzyme
MGVKGFQGTSLLDFPGRIASLVFFGGCNLRCPYCHNPALVLEPERYPDIPLQELLAELAERRGFIDGVVVTGGEPTLAAELLPLLQAIRDLGLQIKLDTNGLAPRMLERLLADGLVDFIACDLKTAPDRYSELQWRGGQAAALQESLALLRSAQFPVEFRTTCAPGWVESADIEAMGSAIEGAQEWVLHQFVATHAMDPACQSLPPHTEETLQALAALARNYVPRVRLRGL